MENWFHYVKVLFILNISKKLINLHGRFVRIKIEGRILWWKKY